MLHSIIEDDGGGRGLDSFYPSGIFIGVER